MPTEEYDSRDAGSSGGSGTCPPTGDCSGEVIGSWIGVLRSLPGRPYSCRRHMEKPVDEAGSMSLIAGAILTVSKVRNALLDALGTNPGRCGGESDADPEAAA